jgi:deazaflavin-dependent oxidoreductase (nitroreductase family)
MQAPRLLRRINRAFTNPLMSTFAGSLPPLALVHHVGRRSGRRYTTPVVVFAAKGTYVIPLPYGIDTDWCRNVRKARRCTLESGGRLVRLGKPRIARTRAALPYIPSVLHPGLRLADLPGYLMLERSGAQKREKRA